MGRRDLADRTRIFARNIVHFVRSFQADAVGRVISYQLLKASTSVGANSHEAAHAISRREFIHKIGLAQKECAEALYWLKLCGDVSLGPSDQQQILGREADEFLAILVTIARKSRKSSPGKR